MTKSSRGRAVSLRMKDAAPDMLAALKTADMFLDHLKNSWEVCAHTQAMMDAVKAAIAKAEIAA